MISFHHLVPRLWLVATLLGAMTPRAWGAPVPFDLPAQSAATALLAFAKQAGVEVLFSYAELSEVRGNAVSGTLEPAEAIKRLLLGTGFVAERTASGKFVVVRERHRTASIRGLVVALVGGAPIAGAIVSARNQSTGTRTRYDGWFRVDGIPADTTSLTIRASGYTNLQVTDLTLRPGELNDVGAIRLTEASDGPESLRELVVHSTQLDPSDPLAALALDTFVVTPSRFTLEEERGPIAATLTQTDLLALPQLGEDLYRAISHLPGLAADDLTARFCVRGAPYDQVLARLDGVDLIEPFHLPDTDSSLSIVDLETIGRLDLCTGGFTAEYGNRLAGVLALETDRHERLRPTTTLGISLTGLRLGQRGRTADGKHRWLASARSGYPDLALKAAVSDGEIKPRYYDLMGKWEWQATPDQVWSFHVLHAGDRMSLKEDTGSVLTSAYASDYAWARWQGTFGRVTGETVAAFTHTWRNRDADGVLDRFYPFASHDRREFTLGTLRQDWSFSLTERALLRTGFDVQTGTVDYAYDAFRQKVVPAGRSYVLGRVSRDLRFEPSGTWGGGYTIARFRPLPSLTAEAGCRYDANDYAHDRDVSPRFNLAWQGGHTTVRAAWSRFAQPQGLNQLSIGDGESSFRSSERAEHRIVSVERHLARGINLRLEGYERRSIRPQPRWENVTDPLTAVPEMTTDRVRIDPVASRARGIELILEQRAGQRFAWSASYAFARARDVLAGGIEVPRPRDQEHTVYVDVSCSPAPRWQLSAAWQFHTGWPITVPRFALYPVATGGSIVERTFAIPYDARLPDYQRLDLRLQRRFDLSRGTLRLYLDVFNAFNRRNTITYAYNVDVGANNQLTTTRRTGSRLLPVLPSLGAVWEF